MILEETAVKDITDQYGTPCYIYDAKTIEKTCLRLRNSLPAEVDIYYSVKSNPNIALCSEIRKLGIGAELCSYYEIEAALRAGFSPQNMIFVGPGKQDKELKKCLDLGILAIVCESKKEFSLIAKLAAEKNVRARVLLRINPDHVSKDALLKMGGRASQFGIDESEVLASKEFFISQRNIEILGIHVYHGTRILSAQTVVDNTLYALMLAKTLQSNWNLKFRVIDVGGGIGIPYYQGESEFALEEFADKLSRVIANYLEDYPKTRFILESGRYLIGDSGIMVSRIVDIKTSKGEEFIITDGGVNCHMAAVGIGSVFQRNFPMSVVQNYSYSTQSLKKYNITGPLCTPNDLIGKQVLFPTMNIGDLIVINKSGAYGPTASPVMFLSHGFPAEILYKNGRSFLIRERFDEKVFFAGQRSPEGVKYE